MRLVSELRSPLTPAFALVAAALFFSHDPGDSSLPWLGLAALVLAGALFATRSTPLGLRALLPLVLLGLWCAATIAWSIEPDRSWTYSNRTLVYAAFAVVGALLPNDPKRLLYGFALLLGAVAVWALAGKVLPWLHEDYAVISRLSEPVGYWNGLALLGDVALPIGLCLATRRKLQGSLLVFAWIVVIGMTYSRGGVIVGAIVVGAWMVLSRAWIESFSTLLAGGIPAAGALAVAYSLHGLTSDGQTHAVRVRDGLLFGVVLLADAGIAAALSRYSLPATETMRKISMGVVGACAVAAIAVGTVHAKAFWNGSELTNGAGRLVEPGSNLRSAWWREAWDGFKTKPIVGTGAGSFDFTNKRYRHSNVDIATEPHNLPVQFLSETGIVGLGLFLAAVGWLIAVGRRRPGPQLALALALPAYFLHGLLDIDWDFVSVSAPVFLIAGALAVRQTGKPRPRPRTMPVVLAVGAMVAVGCSLFAIWLGNRWVEQANSAVGSNDAHALSLAHSARRIDPYSVEPLFASALTELDYAGKVAAQRGRGWRAVYFQTNARAEAYYKKATEVQPDDAQAWLHLGLFEFNPLPGIPQCARKALDAFNRFNVLDGQSGNNVYYAQALAIVNAGKAKC